jgi:diguanylate cyclase (GGDEF)-like protein
LSYAFLKRSTVLALPALLLVAAFFALHRVPLLPAPQRELAGYAPYLALAGGLGLSLAFNRGRVFILLLLLGLFYLVDRRYLVLGIGEPVPRVLFLCFTMLLPANLLLFCFMRERGSLSHAGRLRLGFLAAQMTAVFWFARFRQDYGAIPDLIARPLFPGHLLSGSALPQLALLCFLAAGLLIAIRVFKRHNPIDSAILGTLVALAVTCHWIGTEYAPPLFVTAAALLLTVGVLQDTHSMAFSDDLTGLPSRRALNEQVLGLGRDYVVAMLDVDHFKRFNDTHGHDVGDQVLKMVGAKIAAVRGGGKPFRYGGEEFTVLFPRKSLVQVTPHLEELRQAIGSYQLWIRGEDRPKETEIGKAKRAGGKGSADGEKGNGKAVSVTISIGVAASSEAFRSPAQVIKAADQALYRAKQRGRNQIAS